MENAVKNFFQYTSEKKTFSENTDQAVQLKVAKISNDPFLKLISES